MKKQSECKRWFAWHPVYCMGHGWVWLRSVMRWNGGWPSQIQGRLVWEYCMPRSYFE